jgi:hypothetical protein
MSLGISEKLILKEVDGISLETSKNVYVDKVVQGVV